jgi:glutamyl-Q tRNA(Asp) synthetase
MEVTRFAPSPTGLLHLGHAYAALRAREAGGRMLLRFEDIDASRVRPEFYVAIEEDLRWLGIRWDGEPTRQSGRMDAYARALRRLEEADAVYPCFCTRKEIAAEAARSLEAPHGPDGPLYARTCACLAPAEREARMASGQPYALRLDADRAASLVPGLEWDEDGRRVEVDPARHGDFVVARKEFPASYHLAVVVDDAHQEVSLVTRGRDLIEATHAHRLLQALLGLPAPRYAHHRLVLGPDGKRLAKRSGPASVRSLREQGWTPGRALEEALHRLEPETGATTPDRG